MVVEDLDLFLRRSSGSERDTEVDMNERTSRFTLTVPMSTYFFTTSLRRVDGGYVVEANVPYLIRSGEDRGRWHTLPVVKAVATTLSEADRKAYDLAKTDLRSDVESFLGELLLPGASHRVNFRDDVSEYADQAA